MEYIKKIIGLNKIDEIASKRKEQLHEEKELDNKIKSLKLPCTNILVDYFMKIRETNRQRTEDGVGSSYIEYIDIAQTNIDKIENELDALRRALKNIDSLTICKNISDLNNN